MDMETHASCYNKSYQIFAKPSGYYYKYTHKVYFAYVFRNCRSFRKLKLKLTNLIF